MIKKLSVLLAFVAIMSISGAQFSVVNNSKYAVVIKTNILGALQTINSGSVTGLINTSDVYCSGDKITLGAAILVPLAPNPSSPFANTQGKANWDVNISCFGGTNKTITVQDAIGGVYVVTN